jgi:3-oxoacyl-[acyl-carrier protein] reductase
VGNLEGKTALVTGASRGIGKAIALALGKAGCSVIIDYREQQEAAQAVAAAIRAMKRPCMESKADVSSSTQAEQLVGDVEPASVAWTFP